MYLPDCMVCPNGGVKEDQSYCGREAVYSRLTNCVKLKALHYYLEQVGVDEAPLNVVNQ